jgi:hypothetical protein
VNFERTCQEGPSGELAGNDSVCMEDEVAVRDQLAKDWNGFNAEDRTRCAQMATTGPSSSYIELLTCLDMARIARKIRAHVAASASTGSVALAAAQRETAAPEAETPARERYTITHGEGFRAFQGSRDALRKPGRAGAHLRLGAKPAKRGANKHGAKHPSSSIRARPSISRSAIRPAAAMMPMRGLSPLTLAGIFRARPRSCLGTRRAPSTPQAAGRAKVRQCDCRTVLLAAANVVDDQIGYLSESFLAAC